MVRNRRLTHFGGGLALTACCLVLLLSTGCAWPMYQGNAQRTGRTGADTSSNKGSVVWTSTVGDLGGQPVLGLGPDNGPVIYTGTSYSGSDQNLYALNMDGSLRWKFLTGGTTPTAPAVGIDGRIYVGSLDGYFYAVNPDGTQAWRYSLPPCSNTYPPIPLVGPAPQGSGFLDYDIYIQDTCGSVVVLNQSGAVNWLFVGFSADPGGVAGAPIAISPDGTVNAVFSNLESGEAGLFALTPSGSLKWAYGIGPVESIGGPAIAPDGTAYFWATTQFLGPSYLYAVNSDGRLKWQTLNNARGGSGVGLAIGADGTVYATGAGLRAFDSRNGNIKWVIEGDPLSPTIFSTPAIGGDGTLFVGTSDVTMNFWAVNPDGTVKWTTHTDCDLFESAPAIGPDGTIYIGAVGELCSEGTGELTAIH